MYLISSYFFIAFVVIYLLWVDEDDVVDGEGKFVFVSSLLKNENF